MIANNRIQPSFATPLSGLCDSVQGTPFSRCQSPKKPKRTKRSRVQFRHRRNVGEVFELEDLVEKPSVDQAPSNLAVAARYICRPSIFDRLERTKPGKANEIQLTDALRMSIREGGRILGVQLAPGEKRYDVG
ncbi:sugar phosphate nucleotidyltransferase, partial [Planctomycetota bacterium]